MKEHGSLSRRLAMLVVLGFALVWLLALASTALVMQSEQEELANTTIEETAHLFLPAVVGDYQTRRSTDATAPVVIGRGPDAAPHARADPDEALVYRLLDSTGQVLAISDAAEDAVFPKSATEGHAATETHVFFTTRPSESGFILQLGDPQSERQEAARESFIALLIPMIAMLPLAYLIVVWISRTALAPLDRLRTDIAARGVARLDPIDTAGQPGELVAITNALNGFMIRLAQVLDGERSFATNAAHELRTPVAVALAQVQQLRPRLPEDQQDALAAVESALKRMVRVVSRLLQMARADAGIGLAEDPQDIAMLLDIVLEDSRRDTRRAGRLRTDITAEKISSQIDADAFAIVVGNLIDNAFQHAPPDSDIRVTMQSDGCVTVTNDGPVVAPADLKVLTKRFERGAAAGEGFGLGLYIADRIARQSGGSLELCSPSSGRTDGFEARFCVPLYRGDA